MFGGAESVLLIVSRVPGYLSGLKLRALYVGRLGTR